MIFEKPTYDSLVEENDIIRTREQGKEGNMGEETVNKGGRGDGRNVEIIEIVSIVVFSGVEGRVSAA